LFKYKNVADGYKMIWNAVPVEFAKQLASVIYKDVSQYLKLHQIQRSEIVREKKEEKNFVSKEVERNLVGV
jgi:DNA (cytosine-5)-methyltransferase 1